MTKKLVYNLLNPGEAELVDKQNDFMSNLLELDDATIVQLDEQLDCMAAIACPSLPLYNVLEDVSEIVGTELAIRGIVHKSKARQDFLNAEIARNQSKDDGPEEFISV
jgi:hypothetical protein